MVVVRAGASMGSAGARLTHMAETLRAAAKRPDEHPGVRPAHSRTIAPPAVARRGCAAARECVNKAQRG